MGEREGGSDQERSASRDLNSGCPKHSGTTCRSVGHNAIGADLVMHCRRYIEFNINGNKAVKLFTIAGTVQNS